MKENTDIIQEISTEDAMNSIRRGIKTKGNIELWNKFEEKIKTSQCSAYIESELQWARAEHWVPVIVFCDDPFGIFEQHDQDVFVLEYESIKEYLHLSENVEISLNNGKLLYVWAKNKDLLIKI